MPVPSKVFVTGSQGLIGAELGALLDRAGVAWIGFDLAADQDILDREAIRDTIGDCDAVVHCAAMLGHKGQDEDEVFHVNVTGTKNVLTEARAVGIKRIVFLSSVNVFGVFKGERQPDYLPIDDAHPKYPDTSYGIAKLLSEEICRMACEIDPEMTAIALRPPGVWSYDRYAKTMEYFAGNTENPDMKFWEYGSFLDVRDMAEACWRALNVDAVGFYAMLLAASDIVTSGPESRDLAASLSPSADWRGGPEFLETPYKSMIDDSLARRIIGHDPIYSWALKGSAPDA